MSILSGVMDLDIAARTIWGEARGEGELGMIAVAAVIRNRAELDGWWGGTVKDVCLKPWQFSAWNTGNPNRAKMEKLRKETNEYRQCVAIVAQVLVESFPDPTGGATHYHVKDIERSPAWTKGPNGKLLEPTAIIGNHKFFRTA